MIGKAGSVNFDDLPELILPYERDLFLWLNSHHSAFGDSFMALYSGKALWIPVALVLLLVSFYKTKWQNAVLFILCVALLATLCDQLSASVIKPFFSRLRPTHHPDFISQVIVVDNYRGGRFGFISSHASNGFGVATFVSLVYKKRALTIALVLWALITCYSRIYLGVHFISDILGGILLGTTIGFLVYLLYQYARIKILKSKIEEVKTSVYTKKHSSIIIATLILSVLFDVAYSLFSI